jgi:hypothetical protein
MDFMSWVNAINQSPARIAQRQAHRAQRLAAFSRIGEALAGSRAAQLSWALEPHDPQEEGGFPVGLQHPGQAAILAVRNAIAEYSIPVEVRTRFIGMQRYSGRGPHQMDDGEVVVEMSFRTLSGVDRFLYVPVRVINGHVLEPAFLIDRGVQRVMCQSTFDDLIKMGTFNAEIPQRETMYSPPPDQRQAPKTVPIVRPGMFGLSPINKQIKGQLIRSAIQNNYVEPLRPLVQAMRDEAPDHLDRAEMPPEKIQAGDNVKLKKGVDIPGRDGFRWHLTKGTKGQVQRDMEGDGRYYYVYFPEVSFTARVRGDLISKA